MKKPARLADGTICRLHLAQTKFHMTTARSLTSLSLMCLGAVGSATAAGSEENSASFDYKPVSNWEYLVPGESWVEITDEISIPHGDQGGFIAKVYGPKGAEKLDIDTNGDGRLDLTCKGLKGTAKLKGKGENGESFTYAVRLRHSGEKWFYATGGVMKGKGNGNTVSLIDANCNGRWNDWGWPNSLTIPWRHLTHSRASNDRQ